MKLRVKGLFRLWVVASLIGVPAGAIWQLNDMQRTWIGINNMIVNRCVDQELNMPSHPDALECGRDGGTYKSVFEREHTTAGAWWSEALATFFLVDVILTAMAIGAFYIVRWVWRGFSPGAPMGASDRRPDGG